VRSRLRKADELFREGRLAEALAAYDAIADEFDRAGFSVKAIAVSRQIVEITAAAVAEGEGPRAAALRRLVRLCAALDLRAEAAEAEHLLKASQRRLH